MEEGRATLTDGHVQVCFLLAQIPVCGQMSLHETEVVFKASFPLADVRFPTLTVLTFVFI